MIIVGSSSFKRQVAGQPLAQVDNPDPFAVPVWRSPVYQTPHFVIWPVQLVRLVFRLIWFLLRHPLLDATIDLVLERYRDLLKRGAMLVDANDPGEEPRALVYLEHAIQDARTDRTGNRRVVSNVTRS